MDFKAILNVRFEEERGTLVWRCYRPEHSFQRERGTVISQAEFSQLLLQFEDAWSDTLDAIVRGVSIETWFPQLQCAREDLARKLVPHDLGLSTLANEGDLLAVCVSPDEIPLEVFPVNDKPFSVYYRTLHVKLDEDGQFADLLTHRFSPDDTIAQCSTTIAEGVLAGIHGGVGKHQHTICKALGSMYGRKQTQTASNRDGVVSVNAEVLAKTLGDLSLDCHYHMGHGLGGYDAGLEVGGEVLRAQRLRETRRGETRRGFTFLNACRSVATGAQGVPDMARVLLENAREAVLGTVIPPLDVQAADFARDFYQGLMLHCCNLVEACYEAERASWDRFQDHADMAWGCYRLYGSPNHCYLRTRATESDGTLVFRLASGGRIRLGSLDGQRGDSIAPEAAVRFMDLLFSREVFEFHDLIENATVYPELMELVSRAIRNYFAVTNKESFAEDIEPPAFVRDLVYRAWRSPARQVSGQALRSQDLFLELSLQSPKEPFPVTHVSTPLRRDNIAGTHGGEDGACAVTLEAAGFIREIWCDIIRTGECGFVDFKKTVPFVRPILEALLREPPTALRIAWHIARDSGHQKIELPHLFQAVITESMLQWANPGRLETLLGAGNPVDRCSELTRAAWKEANWPSATDISAASAALLVQAEAGWPCRVAGRQPFGIRLFASLCGSEAEGFAALQSASSLDLRRLWDRVLRWLESFDGMVGMRTVFSGNGVSVGGYPGRLPGVALRKWQIRLQRAAISIPGQTPVIIVPWQPKLDGLLDVVATWLGSFFKHTRQETDPELAARHWVHMEAEDISHIGATDVDLRRMLREIRRHGLLVLSGIGVWTDPSTPPYWAKRAIEMIRRKDFPALLLVSDNDLEQDHEGIFASRERFPRFHLETLDQDELREFLLEWDKPRHVARDGRDYEDAIGVLSDIMHREWPEADRMSKAVDVLNYARSIANAERHAFSTELIRTALNECPF